MKIDKDGCFVDDGKSWIYVGADINDKNWSKVGKTKNKLSTRSTSSQNPRYVIYFAFQIKHGSIHEIEEHLLSELETEYEGIDHFSTGEKSECFVCNPDDMKNYLMWFIENYYPSSVYYANGTHGGPIHYRCDRELERYFTEPNRKLPKTASKASRNFSAGNNEYDDFNEDDEEFDSNHPDFINDYKIQWTYLKK